MLRDSVCDEVTNIEVCLFDGGDCCLEAKIRSQCKDCSCKKVIEPEKLLAQFKELDIKPMRQEIVTLDTQIANIEDVDSAETCAVVCLEHEKKDEINAWQYLVYKTEIRTCRCGWMKSQSCPNTNALLVGDWKMTNVSQLADHKGYIQLRKTVPCGK